MSEITIKYEQYSDIKELTVDDQELFESAIQAIDGSYSPYSEFSVGAAARLVTGEIMYASNQENSSFPVSICAERALLSYVSSNRKGVDICVLAIIARRNGYIVSDLSPCGMCRQFISEINNKQRNPIKIIFFYHDKITVINNASDLLPLNFSL